MSKTKLEYNGGVYEHVTINEIASNTTIQFVRIINVGGMAPEELFPTMVYMYRGDDFENCRDWYVFDHNDQCIAHSCTVVRDGETVSDPDAPVDTDISHLLQEKYLLEAAIQESYYQLEGYMGDSLRNGCIKRIIDNATVEVTY